MLEMLALFVLLLLTLVIAKRIIRKRRKSKKTADPLKTALDLWVEDVLAVELARKIGTDREVVLEALRNNQVEAVGSVEQAVQSVQLAFERLPGSKEAEVRVELAYEDGTKHVSRKKLGWSDLPTAVRDEFARTAAAHVYRPWHFPWS